MTKRSNVPTVLNNQKKSVAKNIMTSKLLGTIVKKKKTINQILERSSHQSSEAGDQMDNQSDTTKKIGELTIQSKATPSAPKGKSRFIDF
jgi:hypothetical protein